MHICVADSHIWQGRCPLVVLSKNYVQYTLYLNIIPTWIHWIWRLASYFEALVWSYEHQQHKSQPEAGFSLFLSFQCSFEKTITCHQTTAWPASQLNEELPSQVQCFAQSQLMGSNFQLGDFFYLWNCERCKKGLRGADHSQTAMPIEQRTGSANIHRAFLQIVSYSSASEDQDFHDLGGSWGFCCHCWGSWWGPRKPAV